jgi:hypothetical protein
VEGTVLREGDRVRIIAQLIHAATDEHVWADDYVGELENILALQREVAARTSKAVLDAVRSAEEDRGLARRCSAVIRFRLPPRGSVAGMRHPGLGALVATWLAAVA